MFQQFGRDAVLLPVHQFGKRKFLFPELVGLDGLFGLFFGSARRTVAGGTETGVPEASPKPKSRSMISSISTKSAARLQSSPFNCPTRKKQSPL